MHTPDAQQTYPCPICVSEHVQADQQACESCQDVFGVDEHGRQQRIAIGPTDV